MRKLVTHNMIRSGFSALELQVALLLLGIALAGMVPLVVMQTKQVKSLENRWDPDWTEEQQASDYWIDPYLAYKDGPVYYLVPAEVSSCSLANPWARKFGAPARLIPKAASDDPPSMPVDGTMPKKKFDVVTILNPETDPPAMAVTIDDQSAAVVIMVTPKAKEEE